MTSKIARIISAMKEHGWHGDLEEDDGVVHLYAERGSESLDIYFEDDRLMVPAEYSYGGKIETFRTTPALRQRIEDQPYAAPGVKREKLPFTADDDDATILEHILGRKVFCASLIADDFPITEHELVADRLNPPKVVRLDEDRVNVDYLGPYGFRSLRVNNIVRIK